jgi:hypothetical protein
MNQIRTQLENLSNVQKHAAKQNDINTLGTIEVLPQNSMATSWMDIRQSLSAMIIWMILGFAVGLLFGMINPR